MGNITNLIRQKKFRAAELLLRKGLIESPENCYLLTQLANVLWYRHKDKEALNYADKAKLIDPTDPFLLFTRGRILWALEKYESSMVEWDMILSTSEPDIVKNGYCGSWAKSIINDARYYKANCLFCLYHDVDALPLITEHLKHRQKGIISDFSKKEAISFYNVLRYSSPKKHVVPSESGYATEAQKNRITKRMDILEKSKDWNKMVRYLKVICSHYPQEYYLKTVLSEYYKIIGDTKECLTYAKQSFDQEPTDPLVKYNYAVALWFSGATEDSLHQFEEIVALGTDYIAFSEHGEGLSWAKKLMNDTKNYIKKIKK
ncbi:MAG: hypothetical protein LKF31_03545 [Muribaculaceae bacterium]|jgi:predicted Zn-dependent protease|nr:hypothetical protein [Muribaculaceae bacterium]